MSRELIRQLKQLKHDEVSPREEWLKGSRELLLSQIKNTVSDSESSSAPTLEKVWAGLSIFLPKPVVYNFVRPIAVILVVVTVATTAYSGTVKASYETLPGDWLYPAKRATEKTQVTVASIMGDKNTETKLHVEFAKRRAAETKQMVQSGNPQKAGRVSATVADLKTEMNSINSKLDETKQDSTNMQAEVVKDVKENTEQIKTLLQEVKNNLAISTTTADKILSKEVNETKSLVKDVSIKAVEVMLAKHLEGDTAISKEEVKQAISNGLDKAATDAVESKQNVDGAKIIMEAANVEVKDLAQAGGKQNKNSLGPATKEITEQISTVTNQTVAAVLKTEAVTIELGKRITEAKVLLGSDNLAEAVDKMKEAAMVTNEVEKISDTAIEKTQTVSQIVQVIKEVTAIGNVSLPSPTSTIDFLLLTSTTTITNSTTSIVVTTTTILPKIILTPLPEEKIIK
ncbi:MAG: hypothetical protein A2754_00615 [Candidatus Magasanikbacteria bacterium RIFCSPHIGHO2_01_FULL_47_8]|uniref:DUF5667 domain-containing protein n=1 Tax=Candidatus Magasanikbacteria bacterium RIFCSPHIGHO2_01_FULL_47_8 TaxID=1798673 RepID=A0A1F6MBZ8_9BACT|nr:MAG: hypothetical protein A2754_00615 [Candidatus Magasanikbacteria bacterium RIFCSPHIGHO2_01_FULL_47_8]